MGKLSSRMFSAMLIGLVTVLCFILLCSVFISLLLRFSSLTESSFTWVIVVLSFIALFIGGMVSGKRGGRKGWLLGAGTGLLFTILVFLFQYLGYQVKFNTEQYLYHGGYILIAIIGGVLGVNLSNQRG